MQNTHRLEKLFVFSEALSKRIAKKENQSNKTHTFGRLQKPTRKLLCRNHIKHDIFSL